LKLKTNRGLKNFQKVVEVSKPSVSSGGSRTAGK